MRIALWTTVLFSVGCEASSAFIALPPTIEDARSVVFFAQSQGARTVIAQPLNEGEFDDVLQFELSGDAPFSLRALYYRDSLDFMNLGPGLQRESAAGSCTLDNPIAIRTTRIDPDQNHAWEVAENENLLNEERAFFFGGQSCVLPNRCKTFQVTSFALDSRRNVDIMAAVEDRVLAASIDGQFYWVTETGVTQIPALQGAPARALHIDPDGTVWLGGEEARLTRGTFAGMDTQIDIGADPQEIISAISAQADPLERMVLSQTELGEDRERLRLYRQQADGPWQLFYEEEVTDLSSSASDILYVGNGEALVTYGGPTVLYVAGDRVRGIEIDSNIPFVTVKINALARSEDFGVVLGGNDGFLHQQVSDDYSDWRVVEAGALGNSIDGVATAPRGVYFGGPEGAVGQYYPDAMSCPADRLVPSDAEVLIPMGDALVVSGGNNNRDFPSMVSWLVPARP